MFVDLSTRSPITMVIEKREILEPLSEMEEREKKKRKPNRTRKGKIIEFITSPKDVYHAQRPVTYKYKCKGFRRLNRQNTYQK